MADSVITAADVLASVSGLQGTAGATITQGQVLYKDSSDSNKLKLADADSLTAAAKVVEGIALNAASVGQPLSYVKTDANFDPGFTATEGEIYVLSGTAGAIAPEADLASGDAVVILGVGLSTGNIKLNVNNTGATMP